MVMIPINILRCFISKKTSSCTSCFTPFGFMFDVEAGESGISISSIYYRHFTGTVDVKIFTAPGTYADIQRDESAWTQIGFQRITVDGKVTCSTHILKVC